MSNKWYGQCCLICSHFLVEKNRAGIYSMKNKSLPCERWLVVLLADHGAGSLQLIMHALNASLHAFKRGFAVSRQVSLHWNAMTW